MIASYALGHLGNPGGAHGYGSVVRTRLCCWGGTQVGRGSFENSVGSLETSYVGHFSISQFRRGLLPMYLSVMQRAPTSPCELSVH